MDNQKLDVLVNVAFINLFSLGKSNQLLILSNINPKDKRHLACVHIAKLVKDIYGYDFYLPKNKFLTYWKISFKCKSGKWLKPIRKKNIGESSIKVIDMEDFISYMEKANKYVDGFADVYDEYYKR